ncbi:hypothetical protein F4808DRAFT_406770 [Astrocystis sublimbata]|nr:hypothetical protein F4808DRAFT_406770 [Astrocystis sublimbata]
MAMGANDLIRFCLSLSLSLALRPAHPNNSALIFDQFDCYSRLSHLHCQTKTSEFTEAGRSCSGRTRLIHGGSRLKSPRRA